MVETRRLSQLADSASDRLKLPNGDLVVALSGGADSAALAYLCTREGRSVRALHVNHGLAGSDLMENAARTIADRLSLEIEVVAVEVPKGASPEGQARRVRYLAFGESLDPDEVLLTGHTRDDDAETILINIIRGTGSQGLTGIPYYRPSSIYRPILEVDRDETREIAAQAGLAFADDPMNEDPALMRNVLRRRILPALTQLNPRITDSLIRMSAAVSVEGAFVDKATPYDSISFNEGAATVPVGLVATLAPAVADRMLMRMLSLVLGGSAVSADRVERVRSVLEGRSLHQELAAGGEAKREGAMLVVSMPESTAVDAPVSLSPGSHVVGHLDFEVMELARTCRVFPLSKWAAVFPVGTELVARPDGVVTADGEPVWVPGEKRYPVAWYEPGTFGYLSVFAREKTGWTSNH